jgi:hypothetical protein
VWQSQTVATRANSPILPPLFGTHARRTRWLRRHDPKSKEHGYGSRHRSSAPEHRGDAKHSRASREAPSTFSAFEHHVFLLRHVRCWLAYRVQAFNLSSQAWPSANRRDLNNVGLRHVRCSPYSSHASVKPVVIGTACQHDFGRTFRGFGESECRAQRAQASASRRLAEHSSMRVEQGGLWLRRAIKRRRSTASDLIMQPRERRTV